MLDAKQERNENLYLVPVWVLDAKQVGVYTEAVKRFNAWFDSLQEPFRFYVFVGLCVPAWTALIFHHAGYACVWFVVLGIARKAPL